MKKLSVIKLHSASTMTESEMRNTLGGSGTGSANSCPSGESNYACYFRTPGQLVIEDFCGSSLAQVEAGPARDYMTQLEGTGANANPVIFAGCQPK